MTEALTVLRAAELVYLATPYTRYPHGVGQAFRAASKLAARLWWAGVRVHCPVVLGHPISVYGGIHPNNRTFWLQFNQPYIERCDVLAVARMEGWDTSEGIATELYEFRARGRPVYYLDPESLAVSAVA